MIFGDTQITVLRLTAQLEFAKSAVSIFSGRVHDQTGRDEKKSGDQERKDCGRSIIPTAKTPPARHVDAVGAQAQDTDGREPSNWRNRVIQRIFEKLAIKQRKAGRRHRKINKIGVPRSRSWLTQLQRLRFVWSTSFPG